MELTASDLDYVRRFVRQRAGVVLEDDKSYLVEARLLTLARQTGARVTELVQRLRVETENGSLHQQVAEAMTTNETSFFRDKHPFETLKNHVFPELQENRAALRTLNIWCAACSSGQEPYSIAMVLRTHFPELASWSVRITATDFSTAMVERARSGQYSQLEVHRGLPAQLLVKYFERNGMRWRIKPEIGNMVDFREVNLIERWPPLPAMDIVFLRNVLIYFDLPTKKTILGNVRRVLVPGGYLFLGGTETTLGVDDAFRRVPFPGGGCYVLGEE